MTACPGPLSFVGLAQLSDPAADSPELCRHLIGCSSCQDIVAQYGIREQLVVTLERWGATSGDDAALFRSANEKLSAQKSPAGATSVSGDSAPGSKDIHSGADTEGASGTSPGEMLAKLAPPVRDDEIARLGTYRVLRMLGYGGMGAVFLAEDIALERQAALKIILPELRHHPEARKRFLREARSAASIKHDRIVTIYQVGEECDIPFLAMELLHGETLTERLLRDVRVPLAEAVRFGRQVAEGLSVAHKRGLVHRDIKPANIFLEAPHEGMVRCKILDFGLARPATQTESITKSGVVLGTLDYMAPEQALGRDVDFRVDLFSLGCVLYEMVSGIPCFRRPSQVQSLAAVLNDEPPPLLNRVPEAPPSLSNLVERLLSKDPDKRPKSADDVVHELRAIQLAIGESSSSESKAADSSMCVPLSNEELEKHAATVRIRDAARPPSQPQAVMIAAGKSGAAVEVRSDDAAAAAPSQQVMAGATPAWLQPVRIAAASGLALAIVALAVFAFRSRGGSEKPEAAAPGNQGAATAANLPPIKVGVLFSLSGTLRDSAAPVTDAVLFAIEEINAAGGLLGRKVEPVVRDGGSDELIHAREAERLIADDQVDVIFGCWTSSARKRVKEIVEKHDHLLVYPVQYEGIEESKNIVYNGAVPNQQILPAIRFSYVNLNARKFFLIGSDYVFPRIANEIIKDEAARLGGRIVGEEYVPLGSNDFSEVVAAIKKSSPHLIVNTINGDSNRAFFSALRRHGITAAAAPVLSFSVGELDLMSLSPQDAVGHYAAWSYFHTVGGEANRAFIAHFRERFGPQRIVTDPMEAGYFGVHLWAQAVKAAGDPDPDQVRPALKGQAFDAPEGRVQIDPETMHTVRYFRIGKINAERRFDIILGNEAPMKPEPFPPSRKKGEWNQLLTDIFNRYGGNWSLIEK